MTAGSVYMIHALDMPGWICKIGHSQHPSGRRDQLAGASPSRLALLKVWPNMTQADERALHAVLADYRSHCEWFNLPESVAERWLQMSDDDMTFLLQADRDRRAQRDREHEIQEMEQRLRMVITRPQPQAWYVSDYGHAEGKRRWRKAMDKYEARMSVAREALAAGVCLSVAVRG